jgi:hypothetical protein
MSASKLRRSTLSILYITTVIVCLSLLSLAQTPTPTPPPTSANPTGTTLSDVYRGVIDRAGALIPLLQNEIEGPLMPWLENWSWMLAVLVVMFGFARLWRENSGASVDVFWWFGRVGIILALMGTGPTIINTLDTIGQEIAWGGSGGSSGRGVLYRFYNNQRQAFEEGYSIFTKGHFTVEPTGENIKPSPDGEAAVLGVLLDVTSSPQGINNKFETLSHDMPFLFSLLSFARGILAFGDLYLLLLGGFLMIAVRLAAPIMIAIAIDRNLAQRISYPFLWGTIVLTLIWPIVSQLIRAIAYMGGNLAMSLGASDAVYQWNPQVMQEIMSSGAEPYHTVILAVLIMAIAGLSLWASPLIAYRVASGQIYESVSSTISGWMGAIVGAGIEFYAASATAQITRQADQVQALGGFGAEMARAEAGKEAGELGIQARQSEKLAQLFADNERQTKLSQAGKNFQDQALFEQSSHNKRIMDEAFKKELADNKVNTFQHIKMLSADAIDNGLGIVLSRGGRGNSRQAPGGIPGQAPGGGIPGQVPGGSIPLPAPGGIPGRTGVGYLLQVPAVAEGGEERAKNIWSYYTGEKNEKGEYVSGKGAYWSLDTYTQKMYGVHGDLEKAQIDAANAYANKTAGGINQAAALERQANRVTYEGAVGAAKEVRDASLMAAQLRAVAGVMSAVGHNISRNAEQGMTLRY